jgi:hypothetical protein
LHVYIECAPGSKTAFTDGMLQDDNERLHQQVRELHEQRNLLAAKYAEADAELAGQRHVTVDLQRQLHVAKAIYSGGNGWQRRSSSAVKRHLSEQRCLADLHDNGSTLCSMPVSLGAACNLAGAPVVEMDGWVYTVDLASNAAVMAVNAFCISTGALERVLHSSGCFSQTPCLHYLGKQALPCMA